MYICQWALAEIGLSLPTMVEGRWGCGYKIFTFFQRILEA